MLMLITFDNDNVCTNIIYCIWTLLAARAAINDHVVRGSVQTGRLESMDNGKLFRFDDALHRKWIAIVACVFLVENVLEAARLARS